jgi:hypothetical protein
MDLELQGKTPTTQTTKQTSSKWIASLPLVDIYYIGAVGFYWTLIKLDVTPFVTSLYEID